MGPATAAFPPCLSRPLYTLGEETGRTGVSGLMKGMARRGSGLCPLTRLLSATQKKLAGSLLGGEGFPQGLCRKWSGRWIADKSPCISPSRCLLCRGVHWQARPSPINGRSIYFYSGWRRENVRSWQGPLIGVIPLSPQQPSFCSSLFSALEGLAQGEG